MKAFLHLVFLQYASHHVIRLGMAVQKSFWKVVSGVLIFWLVVLFYMSTSLYQTDTDITRTQVQLAKALRDLDHLKSQNNELQALADSLR